MGSHIAHGVCLARPIKKEVGAEADPQIAMDLASSGAVAGGAVGGSVRFPLLGSVLHHLL